VHHTTCMNLPLLLILLFCSVGRSIETDVCRRQHVHGQARARAVVVVVLEWELAATGASTKTPEGDLGGPRLPSRIHVQVRRGHVSPHDHGADHAPPARPCPSRPASPPPAFA
jgi:hypothetical protein